MRTRWAAVGAALAVALGGGMTLIADAAGGGTPITVPQSPLASLSVRMVCWSVWDTVAGSPPPIVDYGMGATAATLTILPVGAIA